MPCFVAQFMELFRLQVRRFPVRISAGTLVSRGQFLFISLPYESEYASKGFEMEKDGDQLHRYVKNEVVLCRAGPSNDFEGTCPNCV